MATPARAAWAIFCAILVMSLAIHLEYCKQPVILMYFVASRIKELHDYDSDKAKLSQRQCLC